MTLRRFVTAAVVLATVAVSTYAVAQNASAITQRRALMDEIGKATYRPIGAMLRGQAPFDAAVVQNALTLIQRNGPRMAALFPPDSRTGAETNALPAIWDDKADFEPRFAKMVEEAAAIAPRVTDLATLRSLMGPFIQTNCNGCHQRYVKT
jgi:cytochrome c556